MESEELNPFIRYAKIHETYYVKTENSVCYDCRIFFISSGKGVLVANGRRYTFNRGNVFYLPPKTRYRFEFDNPKSIKIYVLNFDLTDKFYNIENSLGTATESSFNPNKTPQYDLPKEFSEVIAHSNAVDLKYYLDECVISFLQKTAYFKQYASANLKLALIKLIQKNDNGNRSYSLVQSVKAYIRNNYENAELDNSRISEEFNYHPYHLNRLMKKYSDETLHDYLIGYRLDMAKNYLTTTTLNVTAIAEKTGFASYTHFIETFRKTVGISPLQYRKQHVDYGF